jgi:predicted nucleic acid-binding protein
VAERDHLLEAIRQESRTFFLIDPTDEILRLAQDLLKRSSLRAADSIQLASALSLQRRGVLPLSFLCWDRRLQEAAALEGLFVHDFG